MTGFEYLDPAWLRAKPGLKWSRPRPALAAWVADMDFPIPPPVAAALHRTVDGGDLGYPNLDDGNPLAVPFTDRMRTRHGWEPDPARVWTFTDVLNAVQAILHMTTEPGDAVAVHAPTYPPFLATLDRMQRPSSPIPFRATPEGWRVDPISAERTLRNARVLLLVNPHNPTGRVLTRPELEILAELAAEHDMLVIADEVHAELVYPGHTHIPFASLNDDAARRTVTLTSASKTFNLAGIRTAVAHVGHDAAWRGLEERPERLWGAVANLSVAATLAAWNEGDDWLSGLLTRLDTNRGTLTEFVAERMPAVRCHSPEGTYLGWLDYSATSLGDDPAGALLRRAGVALSPGLHFGPAGAGFARLNFATAPNVLEELLERIARVL